MQKTSSILPSALAAVALAALSHAQGPHIPIPDCLLHCRPWMAEISTFDCGTDCVAAELELGFAAASASGQPYIARFSLPGCPPTGPCLFGDETFEYTAGTTVTIGAGRWAVPGGFWLSGPGSVVQARFSVVELVSVITEQDPALLPWQFLPTPPFNPALNFWLGTWNTSAFDDPAGYLLRVELIDAVFGPLVAYSLAVDHSSCGHFGYGEGIGGANTLELTGGGGTCPGKTAVLTTKPTTAPKVFTSVNHEGAMLSLLGGTLFVEPSKEIFVATAPAIGGVATLDLAIPPNPMLVGLSVFLQSAAFEPSAPQGVAFSNGLRLDFCACP